MTIEQIDQNKIKVTVNKTEQEKFGIDYDRMVYSDINTRRLCEKIISKAYREIGFSVENARLLVEARKDINGLVTLFLTKIPVNSAEKEEYYCQILTFYDSSSLLDAIDLFRPMKDLLVYSSLYDFEGKYFLYFELFSTHKTANRLLRDLLEYGERTDIHKSFLDEHGHCLARDNALQI